MPNQSMRVLLLNPPHPAVSSRCHSGRMPPLGLLAVGGPLLDAGYTVRLLDGEIKNLSNLALLEDCLTWQPDVLLIGHSGSTSAHPRIAEIAGIIKAAMPNIQIVYGGVYPTYHAAEILEQHPQFDIIVRGEGEATPRLVLAALENNTSLEQVRGIAFRSNGTVQLTPAAEPIRDLDAYRAGWELIPDWDAYHYWGAGRAAVVQFSRGCPHQCSYCGQRGFWTHWRHRTPEKVAAEIGELHRRYNVRFVDLADENPTTNQHLWRRFLEALIAENVPVQLVTTIRAGDIVRDADILHLYKKAGFSRILMGIETTNPETLRKIRKGASTSTDLEAVRLLRQHDILSQVAYVVGFLEERDMDLWRGLQQLLMYDPDQINAMYVTPHRWTPFYTDSANREIVESDQSRWDYRHQVLQTGIPQWRMFLWVKLTEAVVQLRPTALWRVFFHRDHGLRKVLQWCYSVGIRAWLYEIRGFMRLRPKTQPTPLETFWGKSQAHQENALQHTQTDKLITPS